MKEVRTVSAEQLAAYQQHFAPQARAVQAMNGRTVVQSP
jgi:carbonic anhydrase